MSKTKHTPGPWKSFHPKHAHFAPYVETAHAETQDSSGAICTLEQGDGLPPEMAHANARLIAAAPEMLAALQLVFDRQYAKRSDDAVQLTAETFDVLTAAIRKATGVEIVCESMPEPSASEDKR